MAIDVTRKHATFFAEVTGVDLRDPDEAWREVEAAFNEHAILLFRNKTLSDEQHITFSERFGPVITATNYNKATSYYYYYWCSRIFI